MRFLPPFVFSPTGENLLWKTTTPSPLGEVPIAIGREEGNLQKI